MTSGSQPLSPEYWVIMKHGQSCREANEQIGSLAMFDVYGKIARCLLSLGKTQGIRTKNHLVVQNKPSNRDSAIWWGARGKPLVVPCKYYNEVAT